MDSLGLGVLGLAACAALPQTHVNRTTNVRTKEDRTSRRPCALLSVRSLPASGRMRADSKSVVAYAKRYGDGVSDLVPV